ncbi:YbaB/EbfC family nucleoid-associated protein [Glycomyces sp. NPDC046736]|uniref:YbaB/EbfC family nucleoid-associated protein n=1 Tax=Glycomyces sp. NPDC046736 TaxID=3155615 RepID=UPI0033F3AD09
MSEAKPFAYEVPEDYERFIEEGQAGLDKVPRNENWEIAQRVLAEAPSREEVAAAQRLAAEAMSALAEFQQVEHTGYDPEQHVKVVLDNTGRLSGIELDARAVRIGNNGIAAAFTAAWTEAETRREEHASAFAGRSVGGVASEVEQVMRDAEAALAAREHERFEQATEDGLGRVAVNLRGRISEVVFLQNNVLNLTDRHTLAEQLLAAVTAAQGAAAAAADAVTAPYYHRLG